MSYPVYAETEINIDSVSVDVVDPDVGDARVKAYEQGRIEAFKQLVNKLSPPKAADFLNNTTPTQIDSMIRGYEVLDEKTVADHYHASLHFSFDAERVKTFFEVTALPPETIVDPRDLSNHPHKAVLVLPVYRDVSGQKLWQDDNDWRNVWYESALEYGGGLVVAALGSLQDKVDVNENNASTITWDSLVPMLKRYGAGDVYILTAFYNPKADPKPALEVAVKKLTATNTETSQKFYTIHSTEDIQGLMVRAANDIAKSLREHQTIDPNKIESARTKEINARADTANIHEWEVLREHLLAHGNIVGIHILSVAFNQTYMVITYRGTSDLLGKTLVASGLRVMQDGDSLILALK